MESLHDGLPKTEKRAVYIQPKHSSSSIPLKKDLTHHFF